VWIYGVLAYLSFFLRLWRYCYLRAPRTTKAVTALLLLYVTYNEIFTKPADVSSLVVSAETQKASRIPYGNDFGPHGWILRVENHGSRTIRLDRVFFGCRISGWSSGLHPYRLTEIAVLQPKGGVVVGEDWALRPMEFAQFVSFAPGDRVLVAIQQVGSGIGITRGPLSFERCVAAATTKEVWEAFGQPDRGVTSYRI